MPSKSKKTFFAAVFLFVLLSLSAFFFVLFPKLTFFSIKDFNKTSDIQMPEIENGTEKIYNNYKYSNNSGVIVSSESFISCSWKPDSADSKWKYCTAVFEITDKRKIKKLLESPLIQLNFKNPFVYDIDVEYSDKFKVKDEIVLKPVNLTKIVRARPIASGNLKRKSVLNKKMTILKYKKIKIKKREFYDFIKLNFSVANLNKSLVFPKNKSFSRASIENITEKKSGESDEAISDEISIKKQLKLNESFKNKTINNTLKNSSLVNSSDFGNQNISENCSGKALRNLKNNSNTTILLRTNLSSGSKEGKTGLIGKVISSFKKESGEINPKKPFAIKISFKIPKYSSNSFNFAITEKNFKAKIDPNVSSCGTLDSANSIYKLSSNVSSDSTCFIISADNITLDCQNHKISFAGSSSGKGIYVTANNTIIKNCIIEDLNKKLTLSSNIFLLNSNNSEIYNNRLIKNANSGFAIYLDTSPNIKIHDTAFNIYGQYSYGIYSASGSENMNISGNDFYLTGEGAMGIYQSDNSNSAIIRNNFLNSSSNDGYGIFIESVNNISLEYNSIKLYNETYGIYSENCFNSVIEQNNISASHSNSFAVCCVQSSSMQISRNNLFANGTEACGILIEANTFHNAIFSNKINISGEYSEAIEIYYSVKNNITNNSLFSNGTESKLVVLNLAWNNSIENNNLIMLGSDSYGVYLLSSHKNNFSNNDIVCSSQDSRGILLGTNTDNYFNFVFSNITGENSSALFIGSGESNATFNNSLLVGDFGITVGSAGRGNWLFANTTYNKKNWSSSAKGNMTVMYYLKIRALNNTEVLPNASVFVSDKYFNTLSSLTNSEGTTEFLLKSFFQNSSTYLIDFNNYSVNATFGNTTLSRSINLSSNKELVINFFEDNSASHESASGGSSGGGGSSGAKMCKPEWKCKKWSKCLGGFQTRVCIDLNKCNSNISMPAIKRKCKSQRKLREVLFDISLHILNKEISNGVLSAVMTLINVGVPGKTNASLVYQIKDSSLNLVYESSENVQIETQTSFIKDIDVSELSKGNYSLLANLTYEGQKEPAFTHEFFSIISEKKPSRGIPFKNIKLTILLLAIAAGIIVALLNKKILKLFYMQDILNKRRNINFNKRSNY